MAVGGSRAKSVMSGGDFFDANVFVYLVDLRAPAKQAVAQKLVTEALREGSAVISFQVVQETLDVLGRKFKRVASVPEREDLLREVLLPLWKVQPSAKLYASALTVQARQGLSFYDSLIVAAALEAGCRRLVTEDLQDGQRIGSLRIENPFRN